MASINALVATSSSAKEPSMGGLLGTYMLTSHCNALVNRIAHWQNLWKAPKGTEGDTLAGWRSVVVTGACVCLSQITLTVGKRSSSAGLGARRGVHIILHSTRISLKVVQLVIKLVIMSQRLEREAGGRE